MALKPFNWTCPYCRRAATITQSDVHEDTQLVNRTNSVGYLSLVTFGIVCPNTECHGLTLKVTSSFMNPPPASGGSWRFKGPHREWNLIPASDAKPLPSYVPRAIASDYTEAHLIRRLSPKAAATLARRALQGMIRDFWQIQKKTLHLEIQELATHVPTDTWEAIDAVRSIGNIGAHMEKDVDVIVDVDPMEAQQLLELIEMLIDEWYVARHERAQRVARVKTLAAQKDAELVQKTAAAKAAKGGTGNP